MRLPIPEALISLEQHVYMYVYVLLWFVFNVICIMHSELCIVYYVVICVVICVKWIGGSKPGWHPVVRSWYSGQTNALNNKVKGSIVPSHQTHFASQCPDKTVKTQRIMMRVFTLCSTLRIWGKIYEKKISPQAALTYATSRAASRPSQGWYIKGRFSIKPFLIDKWRSKKSLDKESLFCFSRTRKG